MYLTPPSRPRDLSRRGGREIIKGRGGGWHQGNSIFQTQQNWYTHELTEAGTACTRPETVQARWNPCTEKKWTPSPTLTKKLFAINTCWERGTLFSPMECPWVYQPHSREGPCSGAVDQHRHSIAFVNVLFVCYFLSCFLFYFISFDFCCLLFSCLFVCLEMGWEHHALGWGGRWGGSERIGRGKEYDQNELIFKDDI